MPYSNLFRTHTARHIRSSRARIADEYLSRRPGWMRPYPLPSPQALERTLDALAEAVASNDPSVYRAVTDRHWEAELRSGRSAVALLELADAFYRSVFACLTVDQQNLVAEVLEVEGKPWQERVREILARLAEDVCAEVGRR